MSASLSFVLCPHINHFIVTTGKTTFLKALAGQLVVGGAHLDGDILYNGDSTKSGKYLIGKVATYADEKEQHAPTLTVRETMEFAWKMTTGGHHSYSVAKDVKSAEVLDKSDHELVMVSVSRLTQNDVLF